MKVKALIAYLQEFDPEKEVELLEISRLYDTIFIAVREEYGKVYINIKNVFIDHKEDLEQ